MNEQQNKMRNENSMNVCLVHYTFCPSIGGVESHLLTLGTELKKKGHDVYVLAGSREGSPPFEEIQGIKVYREDLMNRFKIREQKAQLGLSAEKINPSVQYKIKEMYKCFAEEKGIDIVHAHNLHSFLPEHALALTELHDKGLPTVLTIHNVWTKSISDDILKRAKWDAIVTVSQHLRRRIREQAPYLRNIHLIYHGVDTVLFSPANRSDKWAKELGFYERPAIIHPGRMLPKKGVFYSIKAMERVRKKFPNAVLILTLSEDISDWTGKFKRYKEQLLRTVKKLRLEANIITHSFPYLELPAIYNHCQVVINPAIWEEPFGLVPVEAMSCAKPVIVTKSGGFVESVIDNVTGFIIKKKDVNTLAGNICLLLHDKRLASRMGKAGRQLVLKYFNSDRMGQEVIELYRSAIKKEKATKQGI